jgi:hypothetical protein
LLEIVLAGGSARRFPGTGEGWEQDGCKDADNGDHDQQFNECESFSFHKMSPDGLYVSAACSRVEHAKVPWRQLFAYCTGALYPKAQDFSTMIVVVKKV